MPVSKTIVISCAGVGSRLGIGTTKALVDIAGKPLIIRQLELLKDYQDIRVVVGYQAQKVIETVLAYRKDVLFVFNHDYIHTGTGASLSLGNRFALKKTVSLDGDVLVHPEDLSRFLNMEEDCIGVCAPYTEEPMCCNVVQKSGINYAEGFTASRTDFEWTGLLQMESCRLGQGKGHVYQLLEPLLPIRAVSVRTREIDTMQDYDQAVQWVQNNYN